MMMKKRRREIGTRQMVRWEEKTEEVEDEGRAWFAYSGSRDVSSGWLWWRWVVVAGRRAAAAGGCCCCTDVFGWSRRSSNNSNRLDFYVSTVLPAPPGPQLVGEKSDKRIEAGKSSQGLSSSTVMVGIESQWLGLLIPRLEAKTESRPAMAVEANGDIDCINFYCDSSSVVPRRKLETTN
jgi:hypothetical protein